MKTSYPTENTQIIDVAHGGTGATNVVDARKSLFVPKTNLEDDSISVEYNSLNERILVAHVENDNNIAQIQADASGVWYHKKVNGTWETVPLAISAGGTGSKSIEDMKKALGFAFNDGETALLGAATLNGYITQNATRLYVAITFPKSTQYTPNITITEFSGSIRGCKGYLDSNTGNRDFLASPFTSVTINRTSYEEATMIITKNAAFTNVDNNTPITISLNRIGFRFNS